MQVVEGREVVKYSNVATPARAGGLRLPDAERRILVWYIGCVESLRLDIWLDVACLFRTRSEAQKACKSGRVEVNDQAAKPHREIRPGDTISIKRPLGRRQRVVVKALADRHIAKAEARELYEDITPPPTPEEVEARHVARLDATVSPRRSDCFSRQASAPRDPEAQGAELTVRPRQGTWSTGVL